MSEVVSGMLTLGGWNGGQRLGCRTRVKPKISLEGCAGFLIAKNEAQSTLWTFRLLKQAAKLYIVSPDTRQLPETVIWAFHITIKPPLLKPASSRLTKVKAWS